MRYIVFRVCASVTYLQPGRGLSPRSVREVPLSPAHSGLCAMRLGARQPIAGTDREQLACAHTGTYNQTIKLNVRTLKILENAARFRRRESGDIREDSSICLLSGSAILRSERTNVPAGRFQAKCLESYASDQSLRATVLGRVTEPTKKKARARTVIVFDTHEMLLGAIAPNKIVHYYKDINQIVRTRSRSSAMLF
jgi:hypothetical protein